MNSFFKITVFLILLLLVIGLNDLLVYSSPGLDNSWAQGLLMAIQKNEIFGQQLILTYGPLGYLNFKTIGPSTNKFFILFLSIFSVFNFYQIWLTLSQKFPEREKFFLFALIFLLIPFGTISDFSFTYLYFLVFWIYLFFERREKFYFLVAGFIVTILFFVKLNLSVISILVFLSALTLAFIKKYFSIFEFILWVIFLFLSIGIMSMYLHVDVFNYLKTTFFIIDSYPDGMSALLLSTYEILFFAFIETIALVFIGRYFYLNFSWSVTEMLLSFMMLGVLFLMHKQAHTSMSPINEYGFLNFLPWLFLLALLILPKIHLSNKIPVYFLVITFFSFLGQQYFWFLHANKKIEKYINLPLNIRINPIDRLLNFINYDYANHFKTNPKDLPNELVQTIGTSSVDIFQKDVDYIFFNQLNYEHRPVIQSYQASSPILIEKNAAKFRSSSAPEYVMYTANSFRGQNPMWVETASTLELLRRYQFIGNYVTSSDSLILLKNKHNLSNSTIEEFNVEKPMLNQEILIPKSTRVIVGKFNFDYSFLGKLSKLLFQPPYLYCKVTYSNGSIAHFRVIPTILRSGVIINKKITTNGELKTFFESAGLKNENIHSVFFYSPFSKGFLIN